MGNCASAPKTNEGNDAPLPVPVPEPVIDQEQAATAVSAASDDNALGTIFIEDDFGRENKTLNETVILERRKDDDEGVKRSKCN
ncbi:hypothetical protein Ahy_B10g101315 [Arachis hypogaea]|uniref:Uncharacterized protein n=1 Tax=Arachis hypogaea TaxID=3818 RepID=A0A444WZD2_ARAHY|nr:hypothetical protein Ahy_B10g101315 [Arachis hypogaea]